MTYNRTDKNIRNRTPAETHNNTSSLFFRSIFLFKKTFPRIRVSCIISTVNATYYSS